jgi:small GTP-binding protein
MKEQSALVRKVVCVGDPACGKTSLINQFTKGVFKKEYKLTIGCDFFVKSVRLPDGELMKLRLWDIGGDERFGYLHSIYYKGVEGAVILYDLTNPSSFENIPNWIEQINKYSQQEPQIPIILVGNKTDLKDERKVDIEKAKSYAKQNGLLYSETSAKDGFGVFDTFSKLSDTLL